MILKNLICGKLTSLTSCVAINFISSKDTNEVHLMHSKSDNKKIRINNKADEVVEELYQSLLSRYQIGLETSITDSPDWIKNKKRTINRINKKENKCF